VQEQAVHRDLALKRLNRLLPVTIFVSPSEESMQAMSSEFLYPPSCS